MKKYLSILLVVAMTAALLAGCGGAGTESDPAALASAKNFASWFQTDKSTALNNITEPGTYYFKLSGNVTVDQVGQIGNGHTVVIDLNGNTLSAKTNQVFAVDAGAKLILKNGTVQSAGADADGGVIAVTGEGSALELDGVTMSNTDDSAISAKRYAGVIYAGGTATVVVKGDSVINGSASGLRDAGGAVTLVGGSCMYLVSGTIQNGVAGNGGNIYLDESAQLYISGGTITGGKTPFVSAITGDGGNLSVNGGAQVHQYGGTITAGNAEHSGGNVYVSNYGKAEGKGYYLYAGSITGGTAAYGGGNIYAAEKTSLVRIYDCDISGGIADNGANIYLSNATLQLYGGTIAGLAAENATLKKGGNIYSDGGVIELYDGQIKDGWTSGSGSNIYGDNTTLVMYGGNVNNGQSNVVGLTNGGGNIYLGGKSVFDLYGGEIAYGTTNRTNQQDATTGPNVMITANTRMQMFGGWIHDSIVQGVASRGGCIAVNGQGTGDDATLHVYGGTLEDTGMMGAKSWGHLIAAYSSDTYNAGFGYARVFGGEMKYTGSKEASVLSHSFHGSRGHADHSHNMFLFDSAYKGWTQAGYVGDCTDRSHNTKVDTVDATCVTPGYTQYHCNTCGDWCKVTSEATGHSVSTNVVEATELVAGYTQHVCADCGVIGYSDIVAPTAQ